MGKLKKGKKRKGKQYTYADFEIMLCQLDPDALEKHEKNMMKRHSDTLKSIKDSCSYSEARTYLSAFYDWDRTDEGKKYWSELGGKLEELQKVMESNNG